MEMSMVSQQPQQSIKKWNLQLGAEVLFAYRSRVALQKNANLCRPGVISLVSHMDAVIRKISAYGTAVCVLEAAVDIEIVRALVPRDLFKATVRSFDHLIVYPGQVHRQNALDHDC